MSVMKILEVCPRPRGLERMQLEVSTTLSAWLVSPDEDILMLVILQSYLESTSISGLGNNRPTRISYLYPTIILSSTQGASTTTAA